MAEYFEIDFLDVESKRSGDAITIRYELDNLTYVHVVDGGFHATGESVVNHIRKHYPGTNYIDNVVVTHPDGDHAGGLRTVLEEFEIGALWMLKPWDYADELIDRFGRFSNVENLKRRLRELYPNINALEDIAIEKGIRMFEPFQGASIGEFTTLSPTKEHYLNKIVDSDKTPEATKIQEEDRQEEYGLFGLIKAVATYIKSLWGDENFSREDTSAENEMSVIQYAELCGQKVLLTGDAGRTGMSIAADYLIARGVPLPGIDKFQVPHHGSRRNLSTELLDRWLGPKLVDRPENGKFSAIISSAKADKDHPRKAVIRACIHRGANVATTEGRALCWSKNAPDREGWSTTTPLAYPEDQEE